MKFILPTIVCIFIVFCQNIKSQTLSWGKAQVPEFNSPQWEHIYRFSFIDSLNGWALSHGVDGTENNYMEMARIFRTDDAGKSWNICYQNSILMYQSIHFVDEKHGWISGNGAVRYTVDGGYTWTRSIFNPIIFYDGLDVCFADTLSGWVVCAGGPIYYSADGGITWQPQNSGTGVWLIDVEFLNSDVGWVVGGDIWNGGVILKTTNGGKSWKIQWSDPWLGLRGLDIIDSLNVWTVGENNHVLHTIDGGITWKKQRIPGTGTLLTSVSFFKQQYGWIVGNHGFIAYTCDGGKTWIPDESGTNVWLSDVAFLDSEKVCIVGSEATFLYYAGSIAPTITSLPETLAVTNETYSYSIVAIGRPKSQYVLVNGPNDMKLNSLTGFLYWTPTRSDTGCYQVTVQAKNMGGTDEQNYFLSVIYRNHPPYISYLFPEQDSIQANLGDTLRFYAMAYDRDEDSLIYKWEIEGISFPDSIIYDPWGWGRYHSTQFIPNSTGEYEVKLSVWDFSDTTKQIWLIAVVPRLAVFEQKVDFLTNSPSLHQNYPNPFNDQTAIRFQLPKNAMVKIEIYNLLGQKIRTLLIEPKTAGVHTIKWDGRDDLGRSIVSGVYFISLEVEQFRQVNKLVLLR